MDIKSREMDPEPPTPTSSSDRCYIKTRYVIAILSFFGFLLNYMLRINMSIALVAMVRQRSNTSHNNTDDDSPLHNEDGEFNWDDRAQSLITGSFFWGYIFTQIPGGRLAEVFGAKYIFGLSICLSGIATLLIPLVSEEDPTKLIILRVIIGILEGSTYPSIHALLARWIPLRERSRTVAFVYSGAQAGTVLTLPMVGFIISHWGWRPAFYVMGVLPIIWFCFWLLFAYNTPESHPRISSHELKYLQDNMPSETHAGGQNQVPWRKILTSSPFYAIIVAGFASNWGFWTLLTLLPTFMKTILHYDIKKNSVLSAVPYLVMMIFGISYGLLADYLRTTGVLSTKNVRKLSCVICLGIPAITLFGVTFVGTDQFATLLLFTIGVGASGGKFSAYLSNHIDIAPNFAGTLLGIANACSTIPGWLAPLVASTITNNEHILANWHEVFYIASSVYAVGCIYFLLFASGDIQPWNNVQPQIYDHDGRLHSTPRTGHHDIILHDLRRS